MISNNSGGMASSYGITLEFTNLSGTHLPRVDRQEANWEDVYGGLHLDEAQP